MIAREVQGAVSRPNTGVQVRNARAASSSGLTGSVGQSVVVDVALTIPPARDSFNRYGLQPRLSGQDNQSANIVLVRWRTGCSRSFVPPPPPTHTLIPPILPYILITYEVSLWDRLCVCVCLSVASFRNEFAKIII